MIRVLLVDDQPLVREGLRAVIGRDPDLAIAGEAENGRDALCRLREVPADVVLMDIRMPVMDGIEATRRITSDDDLGHVRVVALTTFDTDDFLFQSLRAGASGFLLKDSDPQQVRQAIKVAAAGDALLSPGVTRRVIEAAAASSRPDPAPLSYLTEREQEVLAGVGEGLDNVDIGRRLYISPDTVRTHVGRILNKLGARDRAQLVAIAWKAGIGLPHQRVADLLKEGLGEVCPLPRWTISSTRSSQPWMWSSSLAALRSITAAPPRGGCRHRVSPSSRRTTRGRFRVRGPAR